MEESKSLHFTSMCPTCGQRRVQYGLRSALRRLLTHGHPVEAYCVTCDAFWSISEAERAEIRKKLTE
jgi:hypothetical protein